MLYGGVTGFNKYSDKLYEIDLKVCFILFYNKEIDMVKDIKGISPSGRAFHSSFLVNKESPFIIYYGGILQDSRVSKEIFIYEIVKKQFTIIKNSQGRYL